MHRPKGCHSWASDPRTLPLPRAQLGARVAFYISGYALGGLDLVSLLGCKSARRGVRTQTVRFDGENPAGEMVTDLSETPGETF